MSNKEQIIEAIIQRIKDEEQKHSKSIEDWYRIAANKIYATFDIKIKEKMSNKQSSIDFLLTELDIPKLISREKLVIVSEVVRQAKEMHKQEIIAAKDDNYVYGEEYKTFGLGTLGEQYYTETFGK